MSNPNFLESWAIYFGTDRETLSDPSKSVLFFMERGVQPQQRWLLTLLSRFHQEPSILITALNVEGQMVKAQVVSLKETSNRYFDDPLLYTLREAPVTSESKDPEPRESVALQRSDLSGNLIIQKMPIDVKNSRNRFLSNVGSAVWYVYQKNVFLSQVRVCNNGNWAHFFVNRSDYSASLSDLLPKFNGLEIILRAKEITFEMYTHWAYVRTMFKLLLFLVFQLSFNDHDEALIIELADVISKNINGLSPTETVERLNRVAVFQNFKFAPLVSTHFWFKYRARYLDSGFFSSTENEVKYEAPLETKKCAFPTCRTWISFGFPFCSIHMKSNLGLRLSNTVKDGVLNRENREQLELLYRYEDGVFAVEEIGRGKEVVQYSGLLLPETVIQNRYHVAKTITCMPYTFKVNQTDWIDGSVHRDLVFMIRQSPTGPNVKLELRNRELWLIALKDIAPDEELILMRSFSDLSREHVYYETSAVPGALRLEDRNAAAQVSARTVSTLTSRVLNRTSSILADLRDKAVQAIQLRKVDENKRRNMMILRALKEVTDLRTIPNDLCVICLENLVLNGQLIKKTNEVDQTVINPSSYDEELLDMNEPLTVSRTSCDHFFHTTCITESLQYEVRCPTCRKILL